ncbi:MAG: PEP-CTERM sorting domain-containing protein [Thermoguttaceae bacterium]
MNLKTCLCTIAVLATAGAGIRGVQGASYTWDGGGPDNQWSTAQNWSADVAPANDGTATIYFGGTTRPQVNVNVDQSIQQLLFNTGAGPFTLSENPIAITGYTPPASTPPADRTNGLTQNCASTVTINSPLVLANSQNFYVASGKLVLNGTLNVNGKELRLVTVGSGVLEINSELTGNVSGQLAFNGGGTSTVNVASTYKGKTTIFNSTVVLNTDVYATSGGFGDGLSDPTVNLGATVANLHPVLLISGAHTFARNVRLLAADATTNANTFKIGGSSADTATFSGSVIMGYDNGKARALTLTAAEGGRFVVTGNLKRATGATGSEDNVTKVGKGTVVLAGSTNDYLGTTTVSEGSLLVNGTLTSGGGAVSIAGNATLGGTGTIHRAVTLLDNATLAPGDNGVGELTVDSLTLSSGSLINVDFSGSSSDTVVVDGNLVLDGVLNITAADTITPGTYTLFTYTGTLTDNGLRFGTAPAGATYTIDASTPGQVNLAVVPEPATAAMMLGGTVAMTLLLRKRRKQ